MAVEVSTKAIDGRARLSRAVLASPSARAGLVLMVLATAVAFLGPFVAPHAPAEIVALPFSAPSPGSPLGADALGRDLLSRTLFGGRELIIMSVVAALAGVAGGTTIGVLAAYTGGVLDTVLMRAMDVLFAFPVVVFALLFVSVLGPSPVLLVGLVALAHVPSVSRVVRGAAQSIVGTDYVRWAQSVGLPRRTILRREVLPNITAPLTVELGLRLMWSVSALAALSFLGFGIQPPNADWGLMVSENRDALAAGSPLPVLAPLLCIAVFTIGGSIFSEGVSRIAGRPS